MKHNYCNENHDFCVFSCLLHMTLATRGGDSWKIDRFRSKNRVWVTFYTISLVWCVVRSWIKVRCVPLIPSYVLNTYNICKKCVENFLESHLVKKSCKKEGFVRIFYSHLTYQNHKKIVCMPYFSWYILIEVSYDHESKCVVFPWSQAMF